MSLFDDEQDHRAHRAGRFRFGAALSDGRSAATGTSAPVWRTS